MPFWTPLPRGSSGTDMSDSAAASSSPRPVRKTLRGSGSSNAVSSPSPTPFGRRPAKPSAEASVGAGAFPARGSLPTGSALPRSPLPSAVNGVVKAVGVVSGSPPPPATSPCSASSKLFSRVFVAPPSLRNANHATCVERSATQGTCVRDRVGGERGGRETARIQPNSPNDRLCRKKAQNTDYCRCCRRFCLVCMRHPIHQTRARSFFLGQSSLTTSPVSENPAEQKRGSPGKRNPSASSKPSDTPREKICPYPTPATPAARMRRLCTAP